MNEYYLVRNPGDKQRHEWKHNFLSMLIKAASHEVPKCCETGCLHLIHAVNSNTKITWLLLFVSDCSGLILCLCCLSLGQSAVSERHPCLAESKVLAPAVCGHREDETKWQPLRGKEMQLVLQQLDDILISKCRSRNCLFFMKQPWDMFWLLHHVYRCFTWICLFLCQSLDSQAALQSWVDVIERDLDRQFPFHEMFLSKDGHGYKTFTYSCAVSIEEFITTRK